MGQVGAHLRLAIHAERALDWAWEDKDIGGDVNGGSVERRTQARRVRVDGWLVPI